VTDVPPPPPDPGRRPPLPPPNLAPPPGYTPAISSTPTVPVGRVGGLAKAIVVFTAIAIAGALVTALLTPGAADDARAFLAGELTEDQFLRNYTAVAVVQFGQGLGTLVIAVLTMVWMYRMAANVRALGRRTTWAPLFAIFGWVLPPVLVVIPFLMLRELWKASEPFDDVASDDWRRAPDNVAIWIWFLLYGVVQTVLAFVQSSTLLGSGLAGDAESLAESIDDAVGVSVFSSLAVAASGVAWIAVVRQLTAKHTVLTRET
jgi:Domain of unknown function (DUF4328)